MDQNGCVRYPGQTMQVTGDIALTAEYAVVDRVAVYAYHINYPPDAQDSAGNPFADPGILKQYVRQGDRFNVLGYDAYGPTQEPVTYRFEGWATSAALAAAGDADYAGREEIQATSSNDPADARIEIDLWAVWTKYFPVVFDAGNLGTMDAGGSKVEYLVPSGSSLRARNISTPAIVVRSEYEDDITFYGWSSSGNATIAPNIDDAPVTGPVTYTAYYGATPPPAVKTYYGVKFDAGGVYGSLAPGGSVVTYAIASGGSLSASGVDKAPDVRASSGYEFVGWAPASDPGAYLSYDELTALPAKTITKEAVYVAVYAGSPDPMQVKYCAVIFDAGGVYGVLATDGTTSGALIVEEGKSLNEVDGFLLPSVNTLGSDFSFTGWSPAVDVTSPVNDTRTYTARYAYTPQGVTGTFYEARFEIGSYGSYKTIPVTSYLVKEGTSLGAISVFKSSDFGKSNIDVADDFEFIGWSPDFDADAPVYAPRVYRALYAYMPDGISTIKYTPLTVVDVPPDDQSVQALGYEGYYDGAPHGVRYMADENTLLSDVLSFWFDPSGVGASAFGAGVTALAARNGIWRAGLPPDETDVTEKEYDLMFAADAKIPQEVTRKIVIKPRPIVPKAARAEIWVGDDIPLRASYDLTIGYDGKDRNGNSIGDVFDFGARESEFAKDGAPISTTYLQGDPAGDYPIYVKAGRYGNYEIYEGTEGGWPYFSDWRFAGVLHVRAAENAEDNPGGGTDVPDVPVAPVAPVVSPGSHTPTPAVLDVRILADDVSDDGGEAAEGAEDDEDGDEPKDDGRNAGKDGSAGAADTGDDSNPALWMALLIVSLAMLVVLPVVRRH
jgi:hypothetical protein